MSKFLHHLSICQRTTVSARLNHIILQAAIWNMTHLHQYLHSSHSHSPQAGRSPQQMQLLQHQKTLKMKQKMRCRLFFMHWCTIYSEFGHPRISSYQNKIARRTDQLWEFSNELRSQDPNLWAQEVRRRQSDHYLKDVWSWKSSVGRKKWQHLHWLSKPHIWVSWEALQIGSNWS